MYLLKYKRQVFVYNQRKFNRSMKNVPFLLATLLLAVNVLPVSASYTLPNKTKIVEGITKANEGNLSLPALTADQVLSLTQPLYEELTGKKMSLKEKFVLDYVQNNIKKDLKKTGTVNLREYISVGSITFNISCLSFGFLLGLAGVVFVHIFSNNKSFRKSSWSGIGALLILAIILSSSSGSAY